MRYLNRILKKDLLLLLFLLLMLAVGCSEDSTGECNIEPDVIEINNFVHDNMEIYYLWNEEMPNLDPDKQSDTEVYFEALLYDEIDRWSFITDDVDALNDYFSGIRKEFGYSLRFYYLEEGSDRVIALVEYVEPDAPADKAGLKRGDVIVEIDGSWITVNNYTDLYYAETLEIGLGDLTDAGVVDLSPSVNITAEVIQINPILKNVVFETGGKKIGYLAYTSFIYDYNDELEAVFSDFKTQGVSDLILDLRYNGGGSVATARLLASMICPASCSGKLFLRTVYNNVMETAIEQQFPDSYTEWFEDYFESNSNNLDLSTVYVLTTENTASASEMVIYSLAPYMNVVQIGEQTHGKYYGSVTIDDEEGNHSWAIQPIIMRAENVDNSIDYTEGLYPDYELDDNVFAELGTTDDELTAFAISKITGEDLTQSALKSAKALGIKKAGGVMSMQNPLKYEMYMDRK